MYNFQVNRRKFEKFIFKSKGFKELPLYLGIWCFERFLREIAVKSAAELNVFDSYLQYVMANYQIQTCKRTAVKFF